MATVNQSATTLLGIINNILDFSKIEAEKLELELRPTSVKEVLESIRQVVRYDLEQKNLKLHIQIEESIPNIFYVDPVRLKQILLNLVSNAIKFTTTGQITITLKIKKEVDLQFYKIRA
jgi:signal transduction histidine kinase